MQCENNLCIYCLCHECMLESIRLNESGMCSNCLQVRIDDKLLFAEKRKLLRKLHADELEDMVQRKLSKSIY